MSENLKDLIDKAEEDEQSRALMEKTIENLKLEVKSLKNKLKTQKEPFHPPTIKKEQEKEDSDEIEILKEMVTSLRKELNQKDQEKDKLNKKVKTLTNELDQMKEKASDTVKEEILLKTQNSLNNLIEDYSRLEVNNKNLKQKIAELEQEKTDISTQIDKTKPELDKTQELKLEIDSLRNEISSLAQKNQSLIQDIKLLEKKSSSSEELDALVEKLKQNNSLLEEENKGLTEKLEDLKREKLRMLKYERKISDLTEKITELEEVNKALKKRDSILLAKTITAMDLPPHKTKKEIDKSSAQVKPLTPKPVIEKSIKSDESTIIKEKVEQELIKPKEKTLETSKIEKSDATTESLMESTDEDTTRKWQCPHCGNTNKTQIRELDDKNRPIWGNFYAKKYVCGQCGKEWR